MTSLLYVGLFSLITGPCSHVLHFHFIAFAPLLVIYVTYAYRLKVYTGLHSLSTRHLSTSYSHGYGEFVGFKIIANTLGVKRVFWKKVHAFVSEHERESEHNRWYNLSSNPICSGRCIFFVNVSQVINATPLHKHASPLFFPLSPMTCLSHQAPYTDNATCQRSTECCIGWWMCAALFLSCIAILGTDERCLENVVFHRYSIHPIHLPHASCRNAIFHFLCPLPSIYDWIWSSTARRLAWNHFTDWIRLAHI